MNDCNNSTASENTTLLAEADYDRAIEYALHRLYAELPPHLYYHSAWHTAADVLPAVRQLARFAGLPHADSRLLEVAAAYHDIGYVHSPVNHEEIGIEIMSHVLPDFGFQSEQVNRLAAMIRATRVPQSPTNPLEQLLADADLDSLGRCDFLHTCAALWREHAALGRPQGWSAWINSQLRFLRSHSYFTDTAKALRANGKRQNIEYLERLTQNNSDEPPPGV